MALLTEVQKNYGKLKNFVNGEWIDSTTDKWLDIENPSTGAIIGQVPMSTADETKAAIEAAQEAWWAWRETPPLARARLFFKLKELMEQHFENVARIMVRNRARRSTRPGERRGGPSRTSARSPLAYRP